MKNPHNNIIKFDRNDFKKIKYLYSKTKKCYNMEKNEYTISKENCKDKEELKEKFYFLLENDCRQFYLSVYHINNWLSNNCLNYYKMHNIIHSINAYGYANIDYFYTLNIMDSIIKAVSKNKKKNINISFLKDYKLKIKKLLKEIPEPFYNILQFNYKNLQCLGVTLDKLLELCETIIPILDKLYDLVEEYLIYADLFK